MADINITCQKCSTETTISEFVDDSNLKCHSCGATLEKPGGLIQDATKDRPDAPMAPTPSKSKLRVARRKKEPAITKEESQASLQDIVEDAEGDSDLTGDKLNLRPEVKANKSGMNHAIFAGLLFLVLGAGTGYLRYGGVLPDNILELSVLYSWIVFLAFHVMITLKAMTDNMMQGILCLLIPGYSLFYLFAISDNFYLRAAVAGILIGIGQDAALELKVRAGVITQAASKFISTGGGDINQKSTWNH